MVALGDGAPAGMTPTLRGRIQTRLFVVLTVGLLWTAAVTPLLPKPAHMGMSTGDVYKITVAGIVIVALVGLVWEAVYHALQQLRWDKDWPSLFALLVVFPEAVTTWIGLHVIDYVPGTYWLSNPIFKLFAIHFSTTWLLVWLFLQGPIRVIFLRWRFEGGRLA
ncbi:MAG: hypothetical protein NVSMB25_10730 [Thermoleophilaceae bacterium]